MPGITCVFAGPKAEIESQLYQDGNVEGIWVGGRGGCFHDGMDYANRGGLLLLDGWVLDAVVFKLLGEASV